MIDCRVPFAEALIDLAKADERIVAVCNDSVGSSNLGEFGQLFPKRLINVGIAEQNMVGVAAGLANAGFLPYVCAGAPFLTGRALEQIKADVAYSKANVKLCGMSPGLAYGELGATHHSIEDIAWLRAIDGLTIVVPADAKQTREVMEWSATTTDAVYLRISRTKVPEVTTGHTFAPGRAQLLRAGNDTTIIANGTMVHRALVAADALVESGVDVRVLNMATVQPIDIAAITAAAVETGGIVTVEESVPRGGLGGAVAEVVTAHAPTRVRMLGAETFAPVGSVSDLFEHFNLTVSGITDAVMSVRRVSV